jgi:lysozyme
MRLDATGYKLIQEFEGLKLSAYRCSAGVPTIGYGNTQYENGVKVRMGDRITKERAETLFRILADRFASDVLKLVKSKVNQNQFNALVSFAYNVGIGNLRNSTLLKKVNADPNDETIEFEFLKWVNAGGKRVQGLVNRRVAESKMYFKK